MTPATDSAQPRPRYGRIAAFAGAVLTTLVSLSTGLGLLPSGGAPAQATAGGGSVSLTGGISTRLEVPTTPGAGEVASGPADMPASTARRPAAGAVAAPHKSGEGRRVVFDMSRQRVWLVGDDEDVVRTYLVSGSVTDNLGPGTYEVYSRSRQATGIDGSSLEFMVRFTQGDNAAIGFHDIPEVDGEPAQTREQLGTPRSHGCVRQARPDAVALWRFAPVGTPVVVTT